MPYGVDIADPYVADVQYDADSYTLDMDVTDSVYPVPQSQQFDKDGYPVYQSNSTYQPTPQSYTHQVQGTWDGAGYQFKDIYGRAWRYDPNTGTATPVQPLQ